VLLLLQSWDCLTGLVGSEWHGYWIEVDLSAFTFTKLGLFDWVSGF